MYFLMWIVGLGTEVRALCIGRIALRLHVFQKLYGGAVLNQRRGNTGMNDKEIVDGAERMARTLLALTGVITDEPSLRNSRDPRVVPVWRSVAMLLET
jgi:hypothetical protein